MTTRFETLSAVRHLAQQGDWMVSCDLEDGYHVVGIHDSHQRYMTASLNGKLYSCAALPFGWSGSPAVFGKITKGMDVVKKMEAVGSQSGSTAQPVKVAASGEL